MEAWRAKLAAGDVSAAWDLFLGRYRRLILATVRQTVSGYDDVMDAFSYVCAGLSRDGMTRMSSFVESDARAKFSTWLVVVVRNQAIDWMRRQSGRRRMQIPDGLSELERRIFTLIFADGCTHVQAYETLRASSFPNLSFSEFLKASHGLYRARGKERTGQVRPQNVPLPATLSDEATGPDAAIEIEQLRKQLSEVLRNLSTEDQLAIKLFVIDEIPAARVAELLGWPNAKSVYNHVYRQLAALRKLLESKDRESSGL